MSLRNDKMGKASSKNDEKGRVMTPKKSKRQFISRKTTSTSKHKKLSRVTTESIAEKYRGAFKITMWPEDMDEFVVECIKKYSTS